MHLVIGGRGLVGTALVDELRERKLVTTWTTRDTLDLSQPLYLPELQPGEHFVYLVAAVSKFAECEARADYAWRVNVDAPIALAKHYAKAGAFIVFVSSEAVLTCPNTAYARQKAAAEAFMHTVDAAIVRPARVTTDAVGELANFLVDIGLRRRAGVYRWSAARDLVA